MLVYMFMNAVGVSLVITIAIGIVLLFVNGIPTYDIPGNCIMLFILNLIIFSILNSLDNDRYEQMNNVTVHIINGERIEIQNSTYYKEIERDSNGKIKF